MMRDHSSCTKPDNMTCSVYLDADGYGNPLRHKHRKLDADTMEVYNPFAHGQPRGSSSTAKAGMQPSP